MRKHLLRLDCILPLNYPRYDFDKPRLGFYQRPKPILEMHVGIFRMQHLGPKLRDNQILQDFDKSFGNLGLGVVQFHATAGGATGSEAILSDSASQRSLRPNQSDANFCCDGSCAMMAA